MRLPTGATIGPDACPPALRPARRTPLPAAARFTQSRPHRSPGPPPQAASAPLRGARTPRDSRASSSPTARRAALGTGVRGCAAAAGADGFRRPPDRGVHAVGLQGGRRACTHWRSTARTRASAARRGRRARCLARRRASPVVACAAARAGRRKEQRGRCGGGSGGGGRRDRVLATGVAWAAPAPHAPTHLTVHLHATRPSPPDHPMRPDVSPRLEHLPHGPQ